ncbi:hypothetical protein BHE74_00043200 [Ensete ventricosum]|nr:hypothetical protein BHE74_00043200 [Ensete ventricosum]
MRLNRVESFYAFLLCFHSEGNEEEGQPGMARQAAAKAPLQGGGRLRPGPLQGAAPVGARRQPEGRLEAKAPPVASGEAAGTAPPRGQPVEGAPPAGTASVVGAVAGGQRQLLPA